MYIKTKKQMKTIITETAEMDNIVVPMLIITDVIIMGVSELDSAKSRYSQQDRRPSRSTCRPVL